MAGRLVNCPTVGTGPGVANGNAPGYYVQVDENGNYAGGYMVADSGTVAGATSGHIIDNWTTTERKDGIWWYVVVGLSLLALGTSVALFIKGLKSWK